MSIEYIHGMGVAFMVVGAIMFLVGLFGGHGGLAGCGIGLFVIGLVMVLPFNPEALPETP